MDCPAHIEVLLAVILILGVTDGVTVITTALELACVGLAQTSDDVTTHEIASLLTRVLDV